MKAQQRRIEELEQVSRRTNRPPYYVVDTMEDITPEMRGKVYVGFQGPAIWNEEPNHDTQNEN